MAKERKKEEEGGGGGWMATYGDMVTLLLCFFVLLYAMSSMDEVKWAIIVSGSVSQEADSISQIVLMDDGDDGAPADEVAGGMEGDEIDISEEAAEDAMAQLYAALKEYVEENELESDVQLSQGDGFTFITFLNNIFFAGDSYNIEPAGKAMLDFLGQIAGDLNPHIKEVHILGHTSQGDPYVVNDAESDRFLSSNRAAEVATYLQVNSTVEPFKIIATGYGQYRPISSFETRESRAKNRRVEIIITEHNVITDQLNDFYLDVYDVIVAY